MTQNGANIEKKWSPNGVNFELKRKWNAFGIPSESVGHHWGRPMEVVCNWSANAINYLGFCLEFLWICWAMGKEFVGNSYELLGKPSGIHGELLGN